MTSEPAPISEAARHALEQELADVRAERRTVAATLRNTDTVGDHADQADELQRANDLEHLDARISEITARLGQAADAGSPSTDVVGVGSTVTVRFADGTVETFQIGDVAEELDQTLVTADSPLGRALLGRRPGDPVHYNTPERKVTAVVVSLGKAPGGQE
ncbi:GreA/GreB family elongation factor [Streptomyces sp. NPDC002769]|uniref:GreA/GreB family elongation factor n=1 Tax=Streptomyces sp. NPDC002769 TaxID=3154542 RepID=UPI00331950E2